MNIPLIYEKCKYCFENKKNISKLVFSFCFVYKMNSFNGLLECVLDDFCKLYIDQVGRGCLTLFLILYHSDCGVSPNFCTVINFAYLFSLL